MGVLVCNSLRCSWLFVIFTMPLSAAKDAQAQPVSRVVPAVEGATGLHPLAPVLRFAREEYDYIQRAVHDYSCRIVKRERINGVLQTEQYIRARVRPTAYQMGRVSNPLAILLEFEAPATSAGRRVLFVDGAFDGKMLVRQRSGGITLRISIDGGLASRESTLPITHLGFHNMLLEAIQRIENDIDVDPTGANTRVELFKNATIDDRPCTAIRITHPERQEELDFHLAHVFVDNQSHLPVRLDYYDWPASSAGKPVLLGEFTYRDVRININLSDADFDPARLGFHVAN
jgi:hypothetical protein